MNFSQLRIGPVAAPYLYLRNFNLMSEVGEKGLNTLNNNRFYKLMCFQFLMQFALEGQDSLPVNADEYYYTIDIEMKDSTNTIYMDLYNLAYDIQELLLEYYDLASEACSYNETDDFFNQFFIRGVEARYSENPSEAPWIKATFMYTYLQDLWDNSHGGDQDEILSQAKNLSATVGPDGGTLSALESLINNYDILMGNLFNENVVAAVRVVLENYEDNNDGAAFYVEKTLTADIDVSDLPITDLGVIAAAPEEPEEEEEEDQANYELIGETTEFWNETSDWWESEFHIMDGQATLRSEIRGTEFYEKALTDLALFWDNQRKNKGAKESFEYSSDTWAQDPTISDWQNYRRIKLTAEVTNKTGFDGFGKIRLKLYASET